jgi:hypothetical protein
MTTWSERMERIEAAIKALPLKDGMDGEKALAAARVMIQGGMVFGPIANLPRARAASPNKTYCELDTAAKIAAKLSKHIQSMHSPALRAVETQNVSPLHLDTHLRSLIVAVERARGTLPVENHANVGRPANASALLLAQSAHDVYEWYTGKRATISTHPQTGKRSGKYLEFVITIFDAAGLDADPVTYARQALDIKPAKKF